MRAFRLTQTGQPPRIEAVDRPVPGPGQVLVRIAAAELNLADLLMIEGRYQDTPPAPFTLGMQVAGVVAALGPGVGTPRIGDRVAVFGGQGGLADHGLFDAARCLPLPGAMPFTIGAGFQIAYGTRTWP